MKTNKFIMNKLIIIRGPLGIGKTTIAKRVAEKVKGEYFSIDNVLAELNLDHIDQNEGCISQRNFIEANKAIIPRIKQLINNQTPVIIDGNFYHKSQIENLIKDFPKNSLVFSLIAPLETCIKRDSDRATSYGKEATKAVYNLVSKFNYGQTIDTSNLSIDQIVRLIKEKLETQK